jgi:hypothetical protein
MAKESSESKFRERWSTVLDGLGPTPKPYDNNSAIMSHVTWTVYLMPETEDELRRLPLTERKAILNAVEKLEALGPELGYPHSSAVRDADRLRELRPRAGRSPWRAFYRHVGTELVVAAIGAEAEVDPRGFKRAVLAAETRLADVEDVR